MNVFRTAENLLETVVHQTAVFQRIDLCRAALLCAEAVAAEVFKAALVINFNLACGKIMPAAKVIVCGLRARRAEAMRSVPPRTCKRPANSGFSRKTLFNVSETVEFSLKSDAVCENAASGAFAKNSGGRFCVIFKFGSASSTALMQLAGRFCLLPYTDGIRKI